MINDFLTIDSDHLPSFLGHISEFEVESVTGMQSQLEIDAKGMLRDDDGEILEVSDTYPLFYRDEFNRVKEGTITFDYGQLTDIYFEP